MRPVQHDEAFERKTHSIYRAWRGYVIAVLKSDIAVKISIKIINAFIEMRKFIQSNAQVFQRLDSMEVKIIETNIKLSATDSRIDEVFALMECGDAKFRQGVFFEKSDMEVIGRLKDFQ